MATKNYKDYLDYAGLQKFWEEVKKYFTKEIADATEHIEALDDRIAQIKVTYAGEEASGMVSTSALGEGLGLEATIDMSDFAKKSELGAALTFKGGKTVAEMEALTGMTQGDVYTVIEGGAAVSGSQFKVGNEYAYDGSAWIELGGTVDLSGYLTTAAAIEQFVQKADLADEIAAALEEALADYVTAQQFNAKVSEIDARLDELDAQYVDNTDIDAFFA